MEQNVTEAMTIIARGSSSMAYIVDSIMLFISTVGLMGNSVAMFILTSSVKIRKSKSYILLMNQCLLDVTITVFVINYLALKYLLNWSNMTGSWDLIMCHVVYSQLYITMPIFSSSYNLVAMSVERMTSVVWPIVNKVRCTRRLTLVVAVTTWVFGFGSAAAFAVPVNGIDQANRKCYYWDHFPSRLHAQIYSVLYSIVSVFFPLLVMLTSYAVMYVSISSRRMRPGVKLNVARMLATCVLLFLFCNILKVTLVMVSRFSTTNIHQSVLFVVGVIMVQANSIVNPFIYSLQYMDYKKELKRQLYRIPGWMGVTWGTSIESIYVVNTPSSSVKNDNK